LISLPRIGIINNMKVGFTGTQKGMTDVQRDKFITLMWDLINRSQERITFSHGDCIGADTEAHSIVYPAVAIHIYPPTNISKRAFCNMRWKGTSIVHPEQGYIKRNHSIVDASDILIATPKEKKEMLRSGTWATIRYARKKDISIYFIFPDGNCTLELNGGNL